LFPLLLFSCLYSFFALNSIKVSSSRGFPYCTIVKKKSLLHHVPAYAALQHGWM
jgi:hypothetical protein